MGRTRDAILEALEDLTSEEFKKFKLKLLSVPLREGFGRIPRGPLLSMDAMDLTDKLVSYYLEEYGADLTALVLRDIGMQEVSERLQEKVRKGERSPSTLCRDPNCWFSYMPTHHPHPNVCPLGSFAFCSSYPLKLQKLLLLLCLALTLAS